MMDGDMHSNTAPPTYGEILPDQRIKVWLRFLYLMYYLLTYSPLNPKDVYERFYSISSLIPLKSITRTRQLMLDLHRWGYLYRFGEEQWKGYSYMISIQGLNKLYKKGLIDEEALSYGRDFVLSKLRSVDDRKYKKVINAIYQ